jgi:hypothetical protein
LAHQTTPCLPELTRGAVMATRLPFPDEQKRFREMMDATCKATCGQVYEYPQVWFVDKRSFIHMPFFVQKVFFTHTDLEGRLYRLQAIDFSTISVVIHRKWPALTTTTKLVYILFLVNQQKRKTELRELDRPIVDVKDASSPPSHSCRERNFPLLPTSTSGAPTTPDSCQTVEVG